MIRKVSIKNFKSIAELELELGRVNVFIGENGSGKSNVLEAIALGGAASADKLDNEFLTSRGIRVTEPELMRAAFEKKNLALAIDLHFTSVPDPFGLGFSFYLQNDNNPYSTWQESKSEEIKKRVNEFLKNKPNVLQKPQSEPYKKADSFSEKIESFYVATVKLLQTVNELNNKVETLDDTSFLVLLNSMIKQATFNLELANFIIFSPENTFLRRFEDEEKIQPLGIKGEGLFKLLKVFSSNGQEDLNTIKEYLKAIDWFEDFHLPKTSFEGEKTINIKDRFIDESISTLHQQSANEGFLFLLFYLSLFISKDTPEFFAIDNVEAAFNPKLCKRLTEVFNELAKERKKQVILTTHNPFVLDGLDLKDDEQRLFVIRRNADGHTIATRIPYKETKYKLSEAWMLGYLGGLPQNF